MLKKSLLALPLVALIAGCQGTGMNNSTTGGALLGAAAGAAIADDGDRIEGAVIGGALGAAAGNLVGRTQSGNCVYQRPDGSRYVATCP
ncbi:Glycine zipper 2TM domain protein [Rhodobacteraceae bacterium THAF1]|uniref:glycine zipper 2TM domain-containing protein n=1 Tax=Palleronia sp. THAF1 TaxID=2587842 RepID=UPI000F3D3CB9|nr:glycine zipper 2TM domain-containing protein [Palleronia sp. THAF1]QFU07155.1 Glycine zipper 2TM domain protein [Palleronia sp. THAF1]VDC16690.1 Glycine zipper 2TM domain protein [Rhodobacteraceae bacterium THAF1]